MGGCTSRSRDGSERFQSDYNLVLNQIKLNTIPWKKFVSEVAFYGVFARLNQTKIQAVMKSVGLEKEYNDENSTLRKFLVITHTNQKCTAKDLISIGLLMCKGVETEKGEYLCNFLDSMSEKEPLRDITEKMKNLMSIATKSMIELMLQVLSNPDTKLLSKLAMMDDGVISEAVKQWIPKGREELGKILYDRKKLIEWVEKGELTPTKAVLIAIRTYDSLNIPQETH